MFPKTLVAVAFSLVLPLFAFAQGTNVSQKKFTPPPPSPFPTADVSTSVAIKSCTSQIQASADGTLPLKQGEDVSFLCVLSNTGTATVVAILSGQVTGGEVPMSVFSPVELKKGEVTVPIKIPAPFGNGTFMFVISFIDKEGKSFGEQFRYTGILNTGTAKITSAKISQGPFAASDVASVTFTVSPDPVTLPKGETLTFGMIAQNNDGKLCSFVTPSKTVSSATEMEYFVVPANKSDCTISALKISLRSRGGFLDDQNIIPFTVGGKKSNVNNLWMNIILLVSGVAGILLVRVLFIRYRIKKETV